MADKPQDHSSRDDAGDDSPGSKWKKLTVGGGAAAGAMEMSGDEQGGEGAGGISDLADDRQWDNFSDRQDDYFDVGDDDPKTPNSVVDDPTDFGTADPSPFGL